MTFKSNSIAIYQQIMDMFVLRIASGALSPGERIDSIRDLATQFKVNPNTVQKALNELERDGLLETDRTKGKFVTDDIEKIAQLKHKITLETVEEFVAKVRALKLDQDEVIEIYNRVREGKTDG
ncbi:GntR family transcriptional regulator [Erysipelothrix larvae]|uniref:GntR family transcriptional regulator n=1 Tax=Erysipelothrix larvae TaxID=1514105 RepID=A0A0X8GY48_9FIRM|nr:GntR family transcriptional regulator [Erysipelothrix larvae]AMC92572.1 GntR family transcriptional regulator [Erysipelothrix larvae]